MNGLHSSLGGNAMKKRRMEDTVLVAVDSKENLNTGQTHVTIGKGNRILSSAPFLPRTSLVTRPDKNQQVGSWEVLTPILTPEYPH